MKKIISLVMAVTMLMVSSLCVPVNATQSGVDEDNFAMELKDIQTSTNIDKNTAKSSAGDIREMSDWISTSRWSSVIQSYIFEKTENTFSVLDVTDEIIYLDTYNKSNYELIDQKSIEYELELFGGFYSGQEYNYIVFGQSNEAEDDNKEVLRVVKYDKDFNRISSLAVKDCYTIYPFSYGNLRMEEKNNELIIHTARTRYLTDDGLNHQSQLTVVVDTENMYVMNDLGRFQDNHVGHSFNQFVRYDDNDYVLVDHGDAYPRSIVLIKQDGYYCSYIDLFEIPGEIGANCTGVSVGGFEVSLNNYLVAINTIDHSKVSEYTSFEMVGLDKDERDIALLISPKDNEESGNVKKIYFTDYVNNNKLGSTPYLLKLSENKFALIWEEFEYIDQYNCESNGVKYVFVDENGNMLSDVFHDNNAHLSADCQPIVLNGNIIWYINKDNNKRTFYSIDTYLKFEDVIFEDKFFEYDGTLKTLVISGTLPEDASVSYINNEGTEEGTYNSEAFITAEGYHPLTLNATMKIGYIVNGKQLPIDGYEVGKPWDNCWAFAQDVYQEIWGTDEGEDLLRALDTEDKKITEKNVRNFILSSELGANIRLKDDEDVNMHSLILVQKDNEGFTVYHGNFNGGIYFTHYTYSKFAQHYADYKYFEYILFPDAPEYDKMPQNITLESIPIKTYGDDEFVITARPDATANLTNFTYDSSDETVATIDESGNVTIVGAGETIISVTEAGNEEYAKTTVTKKLKVNKKALEIKADNVTVTYGDAINTNITYTGFIDGEDETVLTKGGEVSGYSAKPNVGEYSIILDGAEATNYEISYVNAKLTVNKKDVTVTQLKVFDKVADTTTNAAINTSSLVIDGMILGDDVAIDFPNAVAAFASSEVGTDIAVTITSMELVGEHAENYNLTNTEIVTTASIKETLTAFDIAAQINALYVVKDSTEIVLPNAPTGYKITLKSSDNEAVVKTDGSVAPVENDTPVGLILAVTNEADETDVADTAVINVTVPASTKINVSVTAEANGTVTGSGEYLKNSDITIVATPDSGYKFSGWYNGGTSVSTSASYTFKAVNDIALVAKFTKKTSSSGGSSSGGSSSGGASSSGKDSSSCVVRFETNGGSSVAEQSLKRNDVVEEPAIPTKEGYTFEGWYTDKELTTAYDFETKVTKGFTLYAKWSKVKTDNEKSDVSNTLPFKDVNTTDWFYDSVKYVYKNALMNGVSENEFAPNTTLTRAMLVTVLYRNEGEPTTNKSIPFADVDMGAYYGNAVSWAKQNDIVNGASETEFAPNDNITREQIAAIMHRYAQYKGYDVSVGENTNILSYNDYDSISEYAVVSMQYAVGSGLMKGKSTSTLDPLDNATRAEIATILQRFIENNK